MGRIAYFFIGAIFFTACASASIKWQYKFYHLTDNTFSGTLLGPQPKDDLPFTECRPVNGKQKCVVVFYSELQAIISDYKDTKQKLIDCQKKP